MSSPIIVVEKELLNAKVFRDLNGTAKTVLFDFLMKRRVKGVAPKPGRKKEPMILNNGEIEYCFSDAEKRGIPRPSFMRARDVLVEKGFIDIAKQGSGGKKGDKSLYAISDRWKDYGTDDFIKAKRQKDTRQGRGFAVYWAKKKTNIGNKNDNPTIIKNNNRKD